MKQRFSALDIQIISQELRDKIVNFRLQNIYDLTNSSRAFVFKFSIPGSKHLVLLDAGFRIHETKFSRTTASTPSNFVVKLRKHLKSKKLTDLFQVGKDRVLVLVFSNGLFYLVLEFFAAGNVLLLDKDYKILSLMRIVPETPGYQRCAVGETYLFQNNKVLKTDFIPEISLDDVSSWFTEKKADLLINNDDLDKENDFHAQDDKNNLLRFNAKNALQSNTDSSDKTISTTNPSPKPKSKSKGKSRSKNGLTIKGKLMQNVSFLSSMLIDGCLTKNGIDPNAPLDSFEITPDFLSSIHKVVIDSCQIVKKILTQSLVNGYIISKKNPNYSPERSSSNLEYIFDDYHPFLPFQYEQYLNQTLHEKISITEINGYNNTVDTFYSTIESTKLDFKLSNQEALAEKKLAMARMEQQRRVSQLKEQQDENTLKGQVIENNAERVSDACQAVKTLIEEGMDWQDIEQLIKIEKKKGNFIAEIIAFPLKLKQNIITLSLRLPDDEDSDIEDDKTDSSDSESESGDEKIDSSKSQKKPDKSVIRVDVDFRNTPWANARHYFELRKAAIVKEGKTVKNAKLALKNAERKINQDLKKSLSQQKEVLRSVRKQGWFEKFYWFISSDGYLVVSGRDAIQTELIYSKYATENSFYVSSDVENASIVFVINDIPNSQEIPPSTLAQAGLASISTSKAWDSKALVSAWWVNLKQISKKGLSGDTLAPGVFDVTGKKNFLPPSPLTLGLGVMFILRDDSPSKLNNEKNRTLRRIGNADSSIDGNINERIDSGNLSKCMENKTNEKNTTSDNINEPDVDSEGFSDFENDDQILDDFPDVQIPENVLNDNEPTLNNSLKSENKYFISEGDNENLHGSNKEQKNESVIDKLVQSLNQKQVHHESNEEKAPTNASTSKKNDYNTKEVMEDINSALKKVDLENSSEKKLLPMLHSTGESGMSLKNLQLKSKAPSTPKVRGKKGKIKKIAKKYANQDEEERQIRMELLGSTKGEEKKRMQMEDAAKKRADLERQQEEYRRKKEEKAKLEKEKREKKLMENDDNDEDDEDDEKKDLIDEAFLDSLVGKPNNPEELVNAVVVCGPWAALQGLKYRIKLVPGKTKKGKAAKECINSLLNRKVDPDSKDSELMWPREKEILNSFTDSEMIMPIAVSKVKVMTSGVVGNKGGKSKK